MTAMLILVLHLSMLGIVSNTPPAITVAKVHKSHTEYRTAEHKTSHCTDVFLLEGDKHSINSTQ